MWFTKRLTSISSNHEKSILRKALIFTYFFVLLKKVLRSPLFKRLTFLSLTSVSEHWVTGNGHFSAARERRQRQASGRQEGRGRMQTLPAGEPGDVGGGAAPEALI